MEILQSIWTALTTPNQELIQLLGIPFVFIEMTVTMLLFTTVLNIQAKKKQKVTYVIVLSLWSILSTNFIPSPINTFLNITFWPLFLMVILKTTFFKSIVAELFPLFIMAFIETLYSRIYIVCFNIQYETIVTIPIYRESIILLIYFSVFVLYKLCKCFNFNITVLDNMDKKNKVVLIINFILGIIAILTQLYLFSFYSEFVPFLITLIGNLFLLAYFLMSIYSLIRTTKLEITEQTLEVAQLYNKSLKILHDNVRAFKHDFSNIVQAIGGYVSTKDLDGLQEYYSQLLCDCQKVNNLTTLSPEVINNPAIYSILASKYHKADELGIKINLDVFLNLNELNMKIYELTRVLGILLDNAIEASSVCDDKIINVEIRNDSSRNRQLIIISNTYAEKDVDTDIIFQKGYSSKPNNSGLGLWEAREIMKKNNNLNLHTSKNPEFFIQQLEMYYISKKKVV